MKKKIKLRDLTKEQWDNYQNNCIGKCNNCVFGSVNCQDSGNKRSWFNNKDLYSDKFLNQEIEIEGPDILDEKEKEYLSAVIKPFRDRVSCIKKVGIHDKYFISIKVYSSFNLSQIECIDLPIFITDIYKGMEAGKCYTLEELGL